MCTILYAYYYANGRDEEEGGTRQGCNQSVGHVVVVFYGLITSVMHMR